MRSTPRGSQHVERAVAPDAEGPASTPLPGGSTRTSAARRLQHGPHGSANLDRLAELAARLVGSAASQVSVLGDEQVVAGGAGLAVAAVGSSGPLEDSLCTVTAAAGAPLVVSDAAADPRVSDLPPVVTGAVGSYLGVPLAGADGHTVGALCVFDPAPREWHPSDVLLLEQLAFAVVTELELAAVSAEHQVDQAAWEVAAEAASIGTFDLDLTTGVLTLDDRLLHLSALDRDTFAGTPEEVYAHVHPDDVGDVIARVDRAVATGGTYDAEYRIVSPDGSSRWLGARGRVLRDRDGTPAHLVGAAYDTTDRRRGEERLAQLLETMAVGFIAVDAGWRMTYVNAEAERITGCPRSRLLGRTLWEEFPATVGSQFDEGYRRAMTTGQTVTLDAYYPEPLNTWVEVRAVPSENGLSLYFLDITARRQAQQAAELLAQVTEELTGTLDGEEAVARLAQLVVPTLADWCIISLVDDATDAEVWRGLRDIASWHHDPAVRPLLARYAEVRLGAFLPTSYVARAITTGQTVLVPDATTAIAATLQPGEAREALVRLAPACAAMIPLRARGRTVGIITLYNDAGRGAIDAQALAVIGDVAARAGLALDNGRLYRQQRDLAEGLQRSLLTEPPEPDHVQVVVRYVPAAEAAQVGGDWYDAFLQRDGATVLVIGDVVGHDTQAAAAMSQVRTLVRGIGAASGAGPADLLRTVDEAMETLRVGTTATAVVARVEQTSSELARGTTHLRWSNAGHPPPMVINPDATVTALAGVGADLLLGVLPSTRRHESEVALDRGATVLLYTDGLVERRRQSLEVGLEHLRDVLEDLAGSGVDLDTLCDQVLARMLPPRPQDDVALVAVRLHPQDEPRPPEAGPRRLPDGTDDVPEVIEQP